MFFLKRSLYLIIFYIAVAMFTCLSFSSFLSSYTNTEILQNGLTKKAIRFEITPGQNGSVSDLKNEQLIERLKANTESFVLYKDEDNFYTKSTYLYKAKLPLLANQPESPDFFPAGYIILDESLMTSTSVRDDKNFFLYQGRSYEVLDSFVRMHKYMYWDSNIFISLDPKYSAYGSYTVEGISASDLDDTLSRWQEEQSEGFSYSTQPAISDLKDRLLLALRDQVLILIGFGVCMLLITVSTFGTTLSWVQAKKDEIKARDLVGANSSQIRLWLLKEYWIVLLISFVIGSILAWLVAQSGIFNTLIQEVTVFGSFISLLFCLVIGTLTALISTSRYNKRMRNRKKVIGL